MGGKEEMENWSKSGGGASHNVPANKNKMNSPVGGNTPNFAPDKNSSGNKTTGTPPVK